MIKLEKIAGQPDTYLGRVYSDIDREYDVMPEYSAVFTMQIVAQEAYLMGMKGIFSKCVYEELKKILQDMGVKAVRWVTHKNGKELYKVTYI